MQYARSTTEVQTVQFVRLSLCLEKFVEQHFPNLQPLLLKAQELRKQIFQGNTKWTRSITHL